MNDRKTPAYAAIIGATLLHASVAYAAPASNPCAGPSALLAILDRPTVGDSACVIPNRKTVVEAGIEGGKLSAPGGRFSTLPNAELRFGLPGQTEFVWLPPNFQHQHSNAGPGAPAATDSGFGSTIVGLKHELGYNNHWQWTVEGLATLPSGSAFYGSHGLGGAFNGIVSYNSGGPLGVSLMLGVSSQTAPTAAGGARYDSVNPDMVVTWLSNPRLQFYGEVYGQSHAGYGHGAGSDADGGVQYLLNRDWEVDLEEGVQLRGNLGGFTHYTGIGLGTIF